jgi:hypothetical protein
MTSQTAQAGSVLITVKCIRVSRAIQNRKGFPRLPLATTAGVLIPRGRRGGRYL